VVGGVGHPRRLFLPFVPLWCVASVALVREGDAAYHQARVDRRIDKQTRRVETSQHCRECHRDLELGTHYFRGAGAGYVLHVASERGWDLHLMLRSHPRRRLRLRHNGRPRSDFRTRSGADRPWPPHPLSRRRH